jgi:hypothetical protein
MRVYQLKNNNLGDEFGESSFYAWMEIPQLKPYVQLMYSNKKEKEGKQGSSQLMLYLLTNSALSMFWVHYVSCMVMRFPS